MWRFVTLAVLIIAAPAFAQLPCGTTDAREQQAEQLRRWSEARQRERLAKRGPASMAATLHDSVIVLPADETTAPFRRPFDLEGRSLLFTRASDETFVRKNIDLEYEDLTGAVRYQPGESYIPYTLQQFGFPFRGRTANRLNISGLNAIFFDTPPAATDIEQFNDAELAASRSAVIAPMWTTSVAVSRQFPDVFVKESSDRVVISWVVDRSVASYDVQATLFLNGDIRFSYKRVTLLRAAGIVITSGEEAWRSPQSTLVSASDAADDVLGNPPVSLRPLLDIDSLAAARIADSNLIEFRIKTHGNLSLLTAGQTISYSVFIGDPALRQSLFISMTRDGPQTYSVPLWGSVSRSPAARMEDDTVVLDVLQDVLVGPLGDVSIRAYSQGPGSSQFTDSVFTTATIDPPPGPVATNFAALASDETSGPIEEAFTLPILSVGGVWSEIKGQYGLKDSDFDGVAIYQNFFTDIVLYAGAYSTGGNAGATGIKLSSGLGPNFPRTPALMHMNKIGYGWNATDANAGHVILHEFGHRWLLQINILEGGTLTRVLDPVSSHPAQYVHTPAAFTVLASTDASCLGGATFTDNGNGTFTSPLFDNFSYSWLDLYLMGLAEKSEVPSFYYIANSDPKLGDAYYPPPQQTFRGTRKEVLMQQVLDAMGERSPAYPDTQRRFRVLFVLLRDSDHPLSDDDITSVVKYRQLLEKNFNLATGGRAVVQTIFPLPADPGRRRVVGK
jgi:hypothetical protein